MRQRYADLDEVEPRPPKALRVAMGTVAALCVAVTVIHVVMVFFEVAPANPISQRFSKQIQAWVHPWFEQSWYLFAPNPQSNQVQIFARTMTTSGGKKMSDWVDISAVDRAEVRHNTFPSHTTQNMLQTSWQLYTESFGENSAPSATTPIQEKYLRNIAVQRVAAHGGGPFQQIQLRIVTRLIALPGSGSKTGIDPAAPDVLTLPWWEVTPDGR